jgi:O-antigen/teichoic acid export membrane protein
MLLLPMASEIHARNDREKLRSLYIVSTRLTLAIFLPIGVALIILAQPLLTVWVGSAYAEYAYLITILVIASLIDNSQWPAGFVLQGMARHQPLAAMTIGSGIANLILSIILVKFMGLTGVALGTLIPTTIVCIGLVAPYAMRVIEVNVQEMASSVIVPAVLPAIPMIIALLVLREIIEPASLVTLSLVAGIGVLPYPVGYLLMSANEFERNLFRKNMGKIIRRVKLNFKQI